MKVTMLSCLLLVAGALAWSGPAFADAKEDEAFRKAEERAKDLAYSWKKSLVEWLGISDLKKPDALAKMRELNVSIVARLRDEPCKDQQQAQRVEGYFNARLRDLSDLVSNITASAKMSCNAHKLVATLVITDFTLKPSPAGSSTKGLFGCTPDQLRTGPGRACVNLADQDVLNGRATHVLVCNTPQLQCCVGRGNSYGDCVSAQSVQQSEAARKSEEDARKSIRCHDLVVACIVDCKRRTPDQKACETKCGSGDELRKYRECMAK